MLLFTDQAGSVQQAKQDRMQIEACVNWEKLTFSLFIVPNYLLLCWKASLTYGDTITVYENVEFKFRNYHIK